MHSKSTVVLKAQLMKSRDKPTPLHISNSTNNTSTRWNMTVFVEQGYVVVAFNPTGSFGFVLFFSDDSFIQWEVADIYRPSQGP